VSFILRKVRFNRWYPRERYTWLADGELQADPLGDLQTTQNALSVWYVEDDESNLDQVVTALAANCEHLAHLDYILFDGRIVSELNIDIADSKAKTPDREADQWHCDLLRLSAQKLVQLAGMVIDDAEPQRVTLKQVRELIRQAVNSGRICRGDLKPGIRDKI